MMHFLWRCHLTRFSKHNLQKYFQAKRPEPIIFAPFSKGHHSMEDGGREGFWSVASYKPTCKLQLSGCQWLVYEWVTTCYSHIVRLQASCSTWLDGQSGAQTLKEPCKPPASPTVMANTRSELTPSGLKTIDFSDTFWFWYVLVVGFSLKKIFWDAEAVVFASKSQRSTSGWFFRDAGYNTGNIGLLLVSTTGKS